MTIAAYLSVALFVGASGAWHLLERRDTPAVRTMFSMAMWMLLVVTPIQIAVGDQHGLNTLEHQPAKIAAVEGHWENKSGESVPLILFGWPDMAAETTRYALEVPHLGSLVLTHSWNNQIRGLKDLRLAVLMGPAGLVALLAGWITTEVGRQPWVVYGVMQTKDAVSNHSALELSVTLIVFFVMYVAVFGTGISYMVKLVAKGPQPYDEHSPEPSPQSGRPTRPLSAVPDRIDPAIEWPGSRRR